MKHVYEINSRRKHPDEIWRLVEESAGIRWLSAGHGKFPDSYVLSSDILIGVHWMSRGVWELRYGYQVLGIVDVWRKVNRGEETSQVRDIEVIEKYDLVVQEAA